MSYSASDFVSDMTNLYYSYNLSTKKIENEEGLVHLAQTFERLLQDHQALVGAAKLLAERVSNEVAYGDTWPELEAFFNVIESP